MINNPDTLKSILIIKLIFIIHIDSGVYWVYLRFSGFGGFDMKKLFSKVSEMFISDNRRRRQISDKWRSLYSNLIQAWSDGNVSDVEEAASLMKKFLYENKEVMTKLGLINNERYGVTMKILNIAIDTAWSKSGFVYHDSWEKFTNEIKKRQAEPTLISL
ncbi:MAG: hypothetical protein MNSN_10730 [Minisyncoccus archaeiphilus]|nr:MAG: hypothetical protein MNSN_10730 [Candidatus Parcubacteria bacterium]